MPFLTPEGQFKKQQELDSLKDQRNGIAERIKRAVGNGDLSENAEFTTAREDQSLVESRIAELENLLRTAEAIDNSKNSGRVDIGSKVTLKHKNSEKTYIIVGSEETDPANGRISHRSPLGQALLNKKINEEATADTPNGSTSFKIASIE